MEVQLDLLKSFAAHSRRRHRIPAQIAPCICYYGASIIVLQACTAWVLRLCHTQGPHPLQKCCVKANLVNFLMSRIPFLSWTKHVAVHLFIHRQSVAIVFARQRCELKQCSPTAVTRMSPLPGRVINNNAQRIIAKTSHIPRRGSQSTSREPPSRASD